MGRSVDPTFVGLGEKEKKLYEVQTDDRRRKNFHSLLLVHKEEKTKEIFYPYILIIVKYLTIIITQHYLLLHLNSLCCYCCLQNLNKEEKHHQFKEGKLVFYTFQIYYQHNHAPHNSSLLGTTTLIINTKKQK